MSLVSLPAIGALFFAIRGYIALFSKKAAVTSQLKSQITSILVLGSMALFIGWLGHLIGIYSAVEAIQNGHVEISPQLLAGGLRVSLITFLYGMIVMVLSTILWLPLYLRANRDD